MNKKDLAIKILKEEYSCQSYCSHGGVCELSAGHEGKHDSRYCQWTDDEGLSRIEADAILLTKIKNDPNLI